MANTKEIIESTIKNIDQWKKDGILHEKLKEFGLKFRPIASQTVEHDKSKED